MKRYRVAVTAYVYLTVTATDQKNAKAKAVDKAQRYDGQELDFQDASVLWLGEKPVASIESEL